MSLAFFGPTPGSVAAGANSGSSKAGRMALYTGARARRKATPSPARGRRWPRQRPDEGGVAACPHPALSRTRERAAPHIGGVTPPTPTTMWRAS